MHLTEKQREDIKRVASIVAYEWHNGDLESAADAVQWALNGMPNPPGWPA